MTVKRLLTFAIILFISGLLFAGPFGIDMGMTLEELKQQNMNPEKTSSSDGYYLVEPPKTHPNFEMYLVRLYKDKGVFWIKAIGKDISDSGYGSSTKSEYEKIEGQLNKSYGVGSEIRILLPGTIWDEPEDFLMSLRRGERAYATKWSIENNNNLESPIDRIFLGLNARYSDTGYLVLEYYSNKHEEYTQLIEDEAASVF